MARDVPHRHPQDAGGKVRTIEEIEVISADLLAGIRTTGKVQTGDARRSGRNQASLHLAGQLQGLLLVGQVHDEGGVAYFLAVVVAQGVPMNQNRHAPAVFGDQRTF